MDLVDLFKEHGETPRLISGEWHSACPRPECGGDDRCIIHPDKLVPRAKHVGAYWCRQCEQGGSTKDFLEKHMNYSHDEIKQFLSDTAGSSGLAQTAENQLIKKYVNIRSPQQILDESKQLISHEYLTRKCVTPCKNLFLGVDKQGNSAVVVPFYAVSGDLKSVQFVHSGLKPFCEKGPNDKYSAKGAFFTVGTFKDGDTVLIGEGLATVLTCWMAEGEEVPAISYGASWNCRPVINALVNAYPNLRLIHLLDNDKNGAALKATCIFVRNPNISFREPSFEEFNYSLDDKGKGPSDFNDIVSMCGQPLSEVKRQLATENTKLREKLMDTLDSINGPKEQSTYKAAVEAPKADTEPHSFEQDFQEDVLSYLCNKKYDDVVNADLEKHLDDPKLFTESYSKVAEGIRKCWEQDHVVTATQIALNVGDTSPAFRALLARIENRNSITADQVSHRLTYLREHSFDSRLNKLTKNIAKSGLPAAEKADMFRKGLDGIQGDSEILKSQAHEIDRIIEEILDPKRAGVPTGFESMDHLLDGGWQEGKLGMITGGAGAGKTAFALQCADKNAENGYITAYLSMEVGKKELSKRSLKRLMFLHKISLHGARDLYKKLIGPNIYIIEGYHGMTLAKVRGYLLSIMRLHKTNKLLLVVDPFQRLGSGNEKLDISNETGKVNELCAQLKELAVSLDIHVLALSDTVKAHKDNKSGEGSARGSYMADHTGDYVIMLRARQDALSAMYGDDSANDKDLKGDKTYKEVVTELSKLDKGANPRYELNPDNRYDKFVALVCPKVRDSARFSPLFIYKPEHHLFIEQPVWRNVFKWKKKEEAAQHIRQGVIDESISSTEG